MEMAPHPEPAKGDTAGPYVTWNPLPRLGNTIKPPKATDVPVDFVLGADHRIVEFGEAVRHAYE
ncbi:hypothetical protein Pph01_77670 [Planotetraspora phitsanulokensis]|uniref:Uncharacterized protein n=1 Tax=Planotetraspora phitsanulokensis TaxID=575192 RepID=A0A8J3UI77_9ACTN|nr:hypothetical protein Pph01_77670 [Planotetraspora phitsanulokensis]